MSEASRPLILHVIHHLLMGGMENGLINLINTLPGAKFRHAIACIEDYSDFRQRLSRPDVEIYALYRSRIGVWKLRRELYRLCRRLRPAILHSRNLSGLDALLPAWLAGVPHRIHGEHGRDVDDLHGEAWRPALLRRLHAPLVEHYITVSKDLQRYLIRRIGVRAERISQIYNGVDTERFSPGAGKPANAFPDGFLAGEPLIVGTVGRIQAVKDQATLARAFARLAEISPQLGARMRLAIIGDGPLLPELQALVQSLGIADRTWLPGALEDIPQVLRGFDVFVLPSLAEGISNTILEAMACELPVLATSVGGNVELVAEDVSGRFFPPGDIDALAQLLGDYAADPLLRRAHAAESRRLAVERFSIRAMVAAYQQVYERLCSDGSG